MKPLLALQNEQKDLIGLSWMSYIAFSLQIIFSNLSQYMYQTVSLFFSILLYLSISIGSLLFIRKKILNLNLSELMLLTCLSQVLAYLGLNWFPDLGLFWFCLPFIGYGAILSLAYQRYSLLKLILITGVSGLIAYSSYIYFLEQWGWSYIYWMPVLAIAPMICLYNRKTKILIGIGIFSLVIYSVLILSKKIYFTPLLEKNYQSLTFESKIDTHVSPLIFSDLYLNEKRNSFYIVTNGRRFSRIIPPKRVKSGEGFYSYIELPYLLSKPKKVLIIGSAGGLNVVLSQKWKTEEIHAVDINPMVFDWTTKFVGPRVADFYEQPNVKKIVAEGRSFIEKTKEKYDLIVLQGVQTGTRNALLNPTVLESFLFTSESLEKMWSLLNDNGGIYIEEYQWWVNYHRQLSLIESLKQTAFSKFKIKNFNDHHAHIIYDQSKKNIRNTDRQNSELLVSAKREGLYISKSPLDTTNLYESFPHVSLVPFLPKKISSITDDRPYITLIRDHKNINFEILLIIAALAFGVSLFFIIKVKIAKSLNYEPMAMFFSGCGYILGFMASVVQASLLIGHFQLSSIFALSLLLFFSMIGGFIAIKINISNRLLFLLPIALLVQSMLITNVTPYVLHWNDMLLRILVYGILIAPFSILAEALYFTILKRNNTDHRGYLFFVGKLGVFCSVIIGMYIQIREGVSILFMTSALFYLIAILFFIKSKVTAAEISLRAQA